MPTSSNIWSNAPLLPVAFSLAAGIVAGRYLPVDERVTLAALVASVIVTLLLHRRPQWQTVGIWLSTALVGWQLSCHEADWPGLTTLDDSRQYMLHVRSLLTSQYRQAGLADEAYAIVSAMTVGDKSALTPAIRHAYNTTGASHVLALSGLHLGILYWLVTFLTVGRRWRVASQVVTLLCIWAFAFLTGLSPSIVRSATMLTVYGLMDIGYRRHASVNVLAFTAIVMLACTPSALFDISFQMSFMSVFSILLFYPLLYGLLPEPWLRCHPPVRWLWGLTVLSLSAQMGVAPLIAYYFHRFSTYFLLANFVVIPEAYLILVGSLVLLVSGSATVAAALSAVTTTAGRLLGVVAGLPLASIELHPTVWQVALLYVVIGSLCVVALLMTNAAPGRLSYKTET